MKISKICVVWKNKNFISNRIKDSLRTPNPPTITIANAPLLHLLPSIKTPGLQPPTRLFSTNPTPRPDLTHIDQAGKARMVDVSEKNTTTRASKAMAKVRVGPKISGLIYENALKKGDVLSIAEVAGVLGAKKTSELIPLCHNIPLTDIKVSVQLDTAAEEVIIIASIQCEGKTGVEMEALTAVTVAALTVYDMCKAVSKAIAITDVQLLSKSGGASGDYVRDEIKVRDYNRQPQSRFQPFVGPM